MVIKTFVKDDLRVYLAFAFAKLVPKRKMEYAKLSTFEVPVALNQVKKVIKICP